MRRGLLLTLLFAVFTGIANAQTVKTFTGSFTNEPFDSFISRLESATGCRVYYKPSDFETFKVTFKGESMLVEDVFEVLFTNTQYYYATDKLGNVFLTSGHYIQSYLPNSFYDKEPRGNSSRLSYLDYNPNNSDEERINYIGRITKEIGSGNATLSGYVKEVASEQPVVGATIQFKELSRSVVTDPSGKYSLSLPKGNYTLIITAVGKQSTKRRVSIYESGDFDILLQEDVKMLKEVVVESDVYTNVKGVEMGVQKLNMKSIKKFAAPMGEVDIMRVVLSLPGVQSTGEASNGLNVRGGSASQNLVLYNNAVVYNPNHLFGFFSSFNADEIQSVEVLKGSFPAEQGGRLSSIIDIRSKKGSDEKFKGAGGIGLLTSRLTLEGPIKKGTTSFLVGVRSSYSDWLLKQVPNKTISNSSASFYDINFNVAHKTKKDAFLLSGYLSNDKFKFNNDSLYSYKNQLISLHWDRSISEKLTGSFTASHSKYNYSVSSEQYPVEAFDMSYKIEHVEAKANFNYNYAPQHHITFGANSILYNVQPGILTPKGDASLIIQDKLQRERALENALFVGENFELNPKILLYAGLRYSFFWALGPRDVYQYYSDVPKNEWTIVDTVRVGAMRSSAFYHGPEYRVSARIAIDNSLSVKMSYNRTRQYLQMLSNTTSISPTDVWKLSDQHIKPQVGNQVSLGVFKNFKADYELSAETYFKWMRNMLDYKDGANLLMNHLIEADVLQARGVAYGVELMVKKTKNKLNGWASYAYSRSLLRTKSKFISETVNDGNFYPSNYDKPHAVNLTANYQITHRVGFTINTTYSTGRPITLPLAKYSLEEAARLFYSERNQYRVPDYFRVDIGFNIEGNHKIRKLAHSSWTVGVYNLTGRKNVYSVFFKSDAVGIQGYKMSVFGAPIPSVTYNFKF